VGLFPIPIWAFMEYNRTDGKTTVQVMWELAYVY
jgi:hypothetical protein